MSEFFFLIVLLIFVGILIFLLRQNQKSSEIWKQEIANLRLEFGQQIQGTVQNINSQIQNTTFQLNQKLDNSISYLSTYVNQAITQMVGTVTSNLQTITESTGQVNQRLDNAARIISELMKQIGEVKEGANQIKSIGQSIARLEDLFTSPKYRGGIGEIMLENIIQDILPKEYYETQFEFKNKKRVDAIIKINNKILPIDSKFPLDNYRKMIETKDENEREKIKKEFFKDIKKKAEEIASSYIRPDEDTFDFAIMYVPSESVYYEIITDEENEILEYMRSKKVIPVSPSVFYAQLSVFNIAFKAIQFEKNVHQIVNSLAKLLIEFDKIINEFETLGKHINNAQSKYSEVDKKLTQFGNYFKQIAGQGIVSD
ncbi:MAG: DNA recombination protein RmuC [Candidatus Kryptonium sp.]|nr:DNA recombination protein RmuC [Candidatus Kryptonium sp.]